MRASFIIVLIFSLMSCAKRPPLVEVPELAKEILQGLEFSRAKAESLRSEAKIHVKVRGKKASLHADVLIRKPNWFYVKIGGFGFSSVLISILGDEMTVFQVEEKKAYQGKTKEGLRRLTGLSFSTEEWIQMALGHMPEYSQNPLEFLKEDKKWTITVGERTPSAKLEILPEQSWLEVFQDLRRNITLSYLKPIETPRGLFPSQVIIESDGGSIDFRYRSIELNRNLTRDMFRLDLPEGIEYRSIQELEGFQR